jgi:hypothetical protein
VLKFNQPQRKYCRLGVKLVEAEIKIEKFFVSNWELKMIKKELHSVDSEIFFSWDTETV